MNATPADHAKYAKIREGLRAQGKRVRAAHVAADAGRLEIGLLMYRAAELARKHPGLFQFTPDDVENETGLQPAEVIYAMSYDEYEADRHANTDDYTQMSDAALAKAVIAYGFSHDKGGAELEKRFPHVAALRDAADLLTRRATDRTATDWLEQPLPPGVGELMDLYFAHVRAIADGEPSVRVEDWVTRWRDAVQGKAR